MKTIFSELGGIFSQKEFGKEKFTVNQVWNILNRENCTDANSLQSVEYLKRGLVQGWHDPKITILRTDEDMIVDGNKTSTAFYNLNSSEEKVNLSVYITSSSK